VLTWGTGYAACYFSTGLLRAQRKRQHRWLTWWLGGLAAEKSTSIPAPGCPGFLSGSLSSLFFPFVT